jgi:hypothetical protein
VTEHRLIVMAARPKEIGAGVASCTQRPRAVHGRLRPAKAIAATMIAMKNLQLWCGSGSITKWPSHGLRDAIWLLKDQAFPLVATMSML